jgi:acyl-ACP thioesterase
MDEGTTCSDNAIEQPADKVVMPKDMEPTFVMTHVMSYSDVGMLGHANNAMYMHWAMDAVDYDITSSRAIKEFTINFNREARPGENVEIYRVVQEVEGVLHVWVEGKVDGASSFCIKMLF